MMVVSVVFNLVLIVVNVVVTAVTVYMAYVAPRRPKSKSITKPRVALSHLEMKHLVLYCLQCLLHALPWKQGT